MIPLHFGLALWLVHWEWTFFKYKLFCQKLHFLSMRKSFGVNLSSLTIHTHTCAYTDYCRCAPRYTCTLTTVLNNSNAHRSASQKAQARCATKWSIYTVTKDLNKLTDHFETRYTFQIVSVFCYSAP